MSLHYLGKHKPQELRTQRTRNHDQIITWLQLNHASLLVSQYLSKMLYATKHAVDAARSATQFISEQHMVHSAQFSCCTAKLHFFQSYGLSSPEMDTAMTVQDSRSHTPR